MYGNYIGGPSIIPNIPYRPLVNPSIMNINRTPPLRTGLRSLLGLGGTNNLATQGITRGINFSSILNNTSKTIGVVKEAIPIVKEVKPMFNNMHSLLKVASVFKDNTDTNNIESSPSPKKTTNSINNYSSINTQNEPNFFL